MKTQAKEKFSLKKRLKSFVYAANGIRILLTSEHNARIHLFLTLIVITLGFVFKISNLEWISICLAIGFVFSIEIINTVVEKLADFISPDKNETVKKIKDLSASGVLISALVALIIGFIIFLPKIIA